MFHISIRCKGKIDLKTSHHIYFQPYLCVFYKQNKARLTLIISTKDSCQEHPAIGKTSGVFSTSFFLYIQLVTNVCRSKRIFYITSM